MHTALMALRSDPSTAHGYAPAELLLGRKLVYPLELKKKDIDLSGNSFFFDGIIIRLTNRTLFLQDNSKYFFHEVPNLQLLWSRILKKYMMKLLEKQQKK